MHLFHATIARVRALGEYIRSHRATSGLFVLSLGIGLLWAGSAHAAVIGDQSGIFNQMLSLITHIMLALARICISLTLFGLKFFIELAKYNGFIDAPPVIIGWVMIRDIANMCFIIVLLVIAFGTILGLDQYEWKKALAKLVVAAILLNFSKLIAQLIIDVAHVVTMTFLNAISATAGGNLINLFHLQGMMSLLASDPSTLAGDDIRLDIFMASVLALVFAAMAMMTIGAYVIVMVFRVVVLWILMILAPLAYIMSVVPQTQGYASEYWSKFTKHVIVAPVMVFFLWLCFATIGSGNIGTQIGLDLKGEGNVIQSASGIQQSAASNPSTSLLEVSTWENMGSFIIAIAFLVIGIGMVQQLGVEGGGLVGGVTDFGKKVFTIASGVAAARYLAPKLAMKMPFVGGDKWVNAYKSAKGAVGVKMGQLELNRNKRAIELEKDYKKAVKAGVRPGVGAYAKLVAAGLVESGGRSAKKAEDWEEAAERQHEIAEKEYSTSSSWGGRVKLDVTAQLHETEKKSDAKKQQKIDDRIREKRMSAEAYEFAIQGRERDKKTGKLIDAESALTEEEKEVYMAKLAEFQEQRGVELPEGVRKNFANSAHRDYELISGLESAETTAKQASVQMAEQEKRDKAHVMHKMETNFEKIVASETRAHEQDTITEGIETGIKKQYLHGAGHEVERRTLELSMRIEADKLDMDTAEANERLDLLRQGVGTNLIARQRESDTASTALANERSQRLSDARAAAANAASKEIETEADEVRRSVSDANPDVAKKKAELETVDASVEKLEAQIGKLNEEIAKLADEATKPGVTEAETAALQPKIEAKEKEAAKLTKKLTEEKDKKQKIKTEYDSRLAEFERKITQATEIAVRKLAEGNADVRVAMTDSLKKMNSILEQRSTGMLNETVFQKLIGDRQQIPFPEEASRSAIASVMKDFNKMTREQLVEAFDKRAMRIASRVQEDKVRPGAYTESERREDELFTQGLAAKIQSERYYDDLTGIIEPILAKIAGFDGAEAVKGQIRGQAEYGGKVGKSIRTQTAAREVSEVSAILENSSSDESRQLRDVLARVAESLNVKDKNLMGLGEYARPNSTNLEAVERMVKTLASQSRLGGFSEEKVLKYVKDIGKGFYESGVEFKRLLHTPKT